VVGQTSRSEAGFTLLEVVIVAAIFVGVLFALFEVVRASANVTQRLARQHAGLLEMHRFTDRLRSEALSTEAIAVTATPCQEISLVQNDSAGYHFWSYRFDQSNPDATQWTIARYAGASPIAPCGPQAGTPIVSNVRSFRVADLDIAALAQHQDPLSNVADTPFIVTAMATSGALTANIDMHVLDANGRPFVGGNHLVEVVIETATAANTVDISPGVKPSSYEKVLQYTCGARGGCGADVPPPGLLAGAEIDTCTASEMIPANDAQPAATSHPNDFYVFDVCPSGTGQCLYVQYWDVIGVEQFAYGSTRHPSDPNDMRMLSDYWEVPAYGPTHVYAPQWDQGVWPPFPYASANNSVMLASAIDPAQNTGSGETNATKLQSDRNACARVRAENGTFYNNG